MREITVNGQSLPDAYHLALKALYSFGSEVPCPAWNTNTKEISIKMIVNNPLQEPMISKLFIGGMKELQQYKMEILDGIMDFEIVKGNWTYTYHDRMSKQIDCVIDELKRDKYSRRAVISLWNNEIDTSIEPPCLNYIHFLIRDNKLNCNVVFRSNDACKATFMNAFALIMLQKKIADALNIEVGKYIHTAFSFHCYERDFKMLEGYFNRITSDETDLAYSYENEWKDMMEEYIPEIQKEVAELNNF